MVQNKETYDTVLNLRKRGFTYSEIAKICGISKGTVSSWLAKKSFSKKVRIDNTQRAARDNKKRIELLNKARTAERKARYSEALRSADTEYAHYKRNPLFIAGLMLYMSCGDSADTSRMRFTSNNPVQHKIFIRFMRDYLGVDSSQLAFWLLLPSLQHIDAIQKKWSKIIGISVLSFGKAQTIESKKLKKGLHNGTGNTIIGNTVLKRKLNRWIELATKELQK